MTNTSVCTLPNTGMGLSLIAVAAVLVVIGVLLWRVPRARRTHVMVAIAVPLAFLAATTQPADAATAACPEQETRLNWGDLDFRGPSDPSPTTSSPGGSTSYDVTVKPNGASPSVTGDGLGGSVDGTTKTFTGTLDLSLATTVPPRILVDVPGFLYGKLTSIVGGSCRDKDSIPVPVSIINNFPLPWTCEIVADFDLALDLIAD